MLRRSAVLCVTPIGLTYPKPFSAKNDRRGRYSCDAVAEELGEDPEYILALSMSLKYSMHVPRYTDGYPAEKGRSSRPGGDTSQAKKMFPLHKRKPAIINKKTVHVREEFGSF